MNYTKGEWKVQIEGDIGQVPIKVRILNDSGYSIAELIGDRPNWIGNAYLIAAATAMYKALKRIMLMDTTTALESMAYSGGDIPKNWMRDEAPIINAIAKTRKEIQDLIRPILAEAEGKQ